VGGRNSESSTSARPTKKKGVFVITYRIHFLSLSAATDLQIIQLHYGLKSARVEDQLYILSANKYYASVGNPRN
jgi:hypothetical protein